MAEASAGLETTRDAFLDGRLMLRQPARGHRAGTDAMLLAAAVPADFRGRVDDVGAGVGAAGLALATRCPGARVRLIENDPAVVALAAGNIAANRLASRAVVLEVDVLATAARREAIGDSRADLVVSNPPFYDAAAFRVSPDAGRRAAHVMAEGGLAAWVGACLDLLAPKGSLVVIHRAETAPALVDALGGARGLALLPVHARAGRDASRVLLRLVKGSRAPFRLAAGLVLHEEDGRFTAEAERLHRGEAALLW